MKCPHKKAKEYYAENRLLLPNDQTLQVRCGRCKKWVGDKEIAHKMGYALPSDFSRIVAMNKIEFLKKTNLK